MADIPLEKEKRNKSWPFPNARKSATPAPAHRHSDGPADRNSFFGPFVSAKMPPQKKK
jgi:hypothetical protein